MPQTFWPASETPVHVQIEVTWRCNWRCVHCYQDDHTVEVLALERLRGLFGELAAAGTMHLIVTGGEPLVRADIFDILEAARGHGLALTLYSNGHLIDETMADRLGRLVAQVEVSALAGDAETHDRLARVPGSFHRVWRAVLALTRCGVRVVVKT